MIDDHSDFDDLKQLWTSDNSPTPGTFKKRIKTSRLKMIMLTALETLVATAGTIAGIYFILQGSHILGASVLMFSIVSFGFAFWARAGAWRISTESVKDELQTSIKQSQARYKWAWGGIWVCGVALIFLAVLAYLQSKNFNQSPDDYADSFMIFSIALLYVAGNLIITAVILENARKQLSSLRLLFAQLYDPNSDLH